MKKFRSVLAITMAGVVAGCGDGAPSPSPTPSPSPSPTPSPSPSPTPSPSRFASGTRFQARTVVADGLDPILLSVFDRQHNRDCWPVRDAAGTVRCGPRGSAVAATDPEMAGHVRALSFGDRLTASEVLTEDGGRFPLVEASGYALQDARWHSPCGPHRLADGHLVCLPPHAAPGFMFADAMCRQPLLQQAQEAEPLLALLDGQPRALGELWTGPLHIGYKGSCGPLGFPYHAPLRVAGAPLADDALVRLHEVERGKGRLTTTALRFGDQDIPSGGGVLLDRQRGMACVDLLRTPAGIRCSTGIWQVEPGELRFRDAGCAQPVLPIVGDEAILLAPADGHPLRRATELRHVSSEWFGGPVTDVWRREGGSCVLRPEKNTFRSLTGSGDWNRFAPLEEWLGDAKL